MALYEIRGDGGTLWIFDNLNERVFFVPAEPKQGVERSWVLGSRARGWFCPVDGERVYRMEGDGFIVGCQRCGLVFDTQNGYPASSLLRALSEVRSSSGSAKLISAVPMDARQFVKLMKERGGADG